MLSKGIVKYGGFVYLVTEEMPLPYGPKENLQVLKMKLEEDKRSEDFTVYRVNLLEADFASVSGKSFSPEVTGYFAREALKAEHCQAEDVNFAYLCLGQSGAVSREVLWDYVGRKLSDGTGGVYEDSLGDGEAEVRGNTEIFQGMVSALRKMQTGSGRRAGRDGGRRRILVE